MLCRPTSTGQRLLNFPSAPLGRRGFLQAWPPPCGRPEGWRRTTEGCWERKNGPGEGRTSRRGASPTLGWMERERKQRLAISLDGQIHRATSLNLSYNKEVQKQFTETFL